MATGRLDALLVAKGIASGRDQARAYILAGQIQVDGRRIDKAGAMVDDRAVVVYTGQPLPFVSRGGLKLAKALETFQISLQGRRVLDLGASTGGFTDCALQNGAREVIAVDVGYGQLAWSLRQDPRVTVLERTNARYLTQERVGGPVDFVSADLSFISLEKVMPAVASLVSAKADLVLLVKPQFEAGRQQVGKKGVVKDPMVHRQVIEKVAAAAAGIGLQPVQLDFSPVTGPEGNIEYLLHLVAVKEPDSMSDDFSALIERVVAKAHQELQPQRRE